MPLSSLQSCRVAPARDRSAGFTLLEVLVALAIVAIALGASLRAAGSLSSNSSDMRAITLAGWSAENRLINLRLAGELPTPGSDRFDCPQEDLHLVCVEEVKATPDPHFQRVELSVYRSEAPQRRIVKLAQLVSDGR